MGKIIDVFMLEEFFLIKEYFNSMIFYKEDFRVLENIKLFMIQFVIIVQVVDIIFNNLLVIDVLVNLFNIDFEGVGVVIRGVVNQSIDVYIILNDIKRL